MSDYTDSLIIGITTDDETAGPTQAAGGNFEKLGDKAAKAGGALDSTRTKGGLLGRAFGGVKSAVGGFVGALGSIGLAGGGISLVTGFLSDSIQESKDAAEGERVFAGVLAHVGAVTGVTQHQADDLASSLQLVTRYTDDQVLATQGTLEQYAQLNKDVLPRATELTLDLGTKMGGSEEASKLLGLALADPAAGFKKLEKQGVLYTSAQEDAIKAMVKAGDTAGAQKLILDGVSASYGGMARAAGHTAAGQMDILSHRMSDLKQTVGDAVLPILNQFTGLLTSPALSGALTFLSGMLTNGIAKGAGLVSAAFQAISPILTNFGTLITSAFGSGEVDSSLLATLPGFLQPIGQWLASVAGNIGTFISALQGGMDPIQAIGDLLKNNLLDTLAALQIDPSIMQPFSDALTAFGNVIGPILTGAKQAWSDFTGALSAGQDIPTALGRAWTDLSTAIGGVMRDAIPKLMTALGDLATSVTTWIGTQVPILAGQLLDWAQAFVAWIGPMIPPAIDALLGFLGSVAGWLLGTALPNLIGQLATWGRALTDWIGPRIMPALAELGKLLGAVGTWLLDTALPNLISNLSKWGKAFVDWVGPNVGPLLGGLGKLLLDVGGWLIGTALPNLVGMLAQWAGAFIGWIGPNILPLLGELGKMLLSLGGWLIGTALPAIVGQLAQWAGAFIGWIGTEVLPKIPVELGKLWDSISGWLGETANNILHMAGELGGNLVEGIKQGLQGAWDGLMNNLHGLIDMIPQAVRDLLGIHSASTEGHELGGFISEGLGDGITAGEPLVRTAVVGLATLVLTSFTEMRTSVTTQIAGMTALVQTGTAAILTTVTTTLGALGGVFVAALAPVLPAWDTVFGGPDKAGTILYKLFAHDPKSFLPYLWALTTSLFAIYVGNGGPWMTGLATLNTNMSGMIQEMAGSLRGAAEAMGAGISQGIAAGILSGIGAITDAMNAARAAATPPAGTGGGLPPANTGTGGGVGSNAVQVHNTVVHAPVTIHAGSNASPSAIGAAAANHIRNLSQELKFRDRLQHKPGAA